MNLMHDIVLETYTGMYITKIEHTRLSVSKTNFLLALIQYKSILESSIRLDFPKKIIDKNRSDFLFLYNQLDPEKSDLFSMNLVSWEEWEV